MWELIGEAISSPAATNMLLFLIYVSVVKNERIQRH